ncbi:MAG: DUF4249 domain-containing protein [Crocinitomicaceae bacterium]|nr:DUF4249 domain-containing protein [Crocinitomicaceae bacterium]
MQNKLHIILFLTFALSACSKEIDLDLPGHDPKLVVDGRIETGQPPFVLLSKSQDIFAPTDLNAFLNNYITGALITVSNGTNTIVLDEICTNTLPVEWLPIIAQVFDIAPEELATLELCFYTSLNPVIFGEVGKTYALTIDFENEIYEAETTIVPTVPLDTVFWRESKPNGNKGFSWARLSDPAGVYNAYYWEVKRLGRDDLFRTTLNPAVDDTFFDGLTFEFPYENPFSFDEGEPDTTIGFYLRGDTVVVKFSSLDRPTFQFLESKHIQLNSNGSPFATPINLPSNISNGARGVWAGYSPHFDTLICID